MRRLLDWDLGYGCTLAGWYMMSLWIVCIRLEIYLYYLVLFREYRRLLL